MIRYLHTLSAILFYVLGSSFFLAYVLFRNNVWEAASLRWLQIGDMPLLLAGLLYGGLSVYRSMHDDTSHSTVMLIAIGFPLVVLFITMLILNFWPAI